MKYRLFIAIDAPLRQEVLSLQSKLSELNLPVVWEEPEKVHLTLNFLGEVEQAQIGHLNKIITTAVSEFSPFNLRPAFLETLYKRHDPSLIYLGLSGDTDVLKELQQRLTKGLEKMALPQPERFLPHITIGRLKRIDPTMTKSFLDKIRDSDFSPLPEFLVKNIVLYRSLLSKSGSHYAQLHEFVLE